MYPLEVEENLADKKHKQIGRWRFWIDRGGTFTDVIGCTPDGRLQAIKLLSNDPERGQDAVIEGLRQLLNVRNGNPLPLDLIAEVRVGTTVATNALLERKGEKTLFVINEGLQDLLIIGDQTRPDLFDLHIRRVAPLYAEAIETKLRLNAQGETIASVDEAILLERFKRAREAGCTSCAICLMHAWRYGAQENDVAALARMAGFSTVAVSHDVAPLMRIVTRAATTVTEAYLDSTVKRHTSHLAKMLPGVPLLFMKSDGGLASNGMLDARDALLSGPAGGVVGAVETARRAGFEQVIGFDMGGTSTDVCHYAGEWERLQEVAIAGVHLSMPMLRVETVAAGGGSVVEFDGARLRVGPASAGADPGPACYGRGGPVTVTDCNLLLGRIDAENFPQVFGPEGTDPISMVPAKQGFETLAEKIANESGKRQSPEAIAAGALTVAVEHMAAAIKRISIARGHNPAECVLNCFGGAGGQHACDVAGALGVNRILVHPYAGVLSALGIGLSDRTVLLERGLEARLSQEYQRVVGLARLLEQEARAAIQQETTVDAEIICTSWGLLRYDGNETALPVEFGPADAMRDRFTATHRRHFGFILENTPVVVAHIRVEARVLSDSPRWATIRAGAMPRPYKYKEVWFRGGWKRTPFYQRQQLPRGSVVHGPAVLIESTGTTVITPEWMGKIGDDGDLLMSHATSERSTSTGMTTEMDPVLLELMSARFMAIAEEMGEALRATAQSINVRERLDYSCALFAADGSLVANAPHMPVHLGAMSATVKALLEQKQVSQGEVWVTNDVYSGGTHLPDITVITPVFMGSKKPQFFVASRAHHADVGGITPGSMPASSRDISEEGVLIPFTRLLVSGQWQDVIIRKMLSDSSYPARNIDRNMADLRAQVAANIRGEQALKRLVRQSGLEGVQAYMSYLSDYAEKAVRRALKNLSIEGHYQAPLDDGSVIAVRVNVDPGEGSAAFDFSGTSRARPGNFNAPKAVVYASVLYVLRTLIAEPIPLNDGCLRPVEIKIPEGSMLDPKYPAAVVAGNVEVSQVLTDTLLAAIGQLAASQGTMNNLTFGNAKHQHYETLAGGAGAGNGFAGQSAVHTHMTNSRLTDPELLEFRYPVVLEKFATRKDSGGKGKWCGGNGLIRRIRFREPMTFTILSNRRNTDPFGLCGGGPGARGENWLFRLGSGATNLNYADSTDVNIGDVIEIRTPGGGGFGESSSG